MRTTLNGSRPTSAPERASCRIALSAAVTLLLLLSSREGAARPRLDPRLSALRHQLSKEAEAGRTPEMIAADKTRPLASGTRILSRASGPTLGIDCILELGDGGREELLRHGITPWTPSGRFVTATLTPEELDIVADLDEINRVDLSRVLNPYLDVSRTLTQADQVNGGSGPTFPVTGFTGRNVVIGIIDTGVDLAHGDFRKPNGQTRISYAWDQLSSTGTPPPGFGFGSEWTEAQINNGQATLVDNSGHGTHVAGIALGDGSATGNGRPAQQYVGVAPEADLIVVKTTFTQSDVLNAIDWVFARAGSRDAVINLSLGTQDGPHDGTSLFDQAVADKLGPGRAIVAAAGNEAAQALHARLTMPPSGTDSLVFTFQVPSYTALPGSGNDQVFLDGWYDGGDVMSFRLEAPSGWRSREIPNNNRLIACTTKPGGEGQILADNNNTTDVPPPPNGDKEFYLQITDDGSCGTPASGVWKVIAYRRGSIVNGAVDLWITFAQLGSTGGYPRFVTGVTNTHLVGSPASAPGVISVGAFVSKRQWQSQATPSLQEYSDNPFPIVEGRIAWFSSVGPLRDGTLAPDLVAPGMGIGSAKSAQATYAPEFSLQDGQHVINQGTSQAAPHVAGAIALLFEKCPHLNPQEILTRLTRSADRDLSTGPEPNSVYGNGKLDAFGTLNDGTPVLACAIQGDSTPDLGSTLAYTDPAAGARNRRWSIVSVPAGIAAIVGSTTGSSVQVQFSSAGTAQLVLSVSDAADPEGCRTVCKEDLDVGLGLFSVLEATPEIGQIRLEWQLAESHPEIQGFYVRRGTTAEGPFDRISSLLTGGPAFEYVDTNVEVGQSYWYMIEAIYTSGPAQLFGPLLASPVPPRLFLAQNGPNPFSGQTTIRYTLPTAGSARIDVYDLKGRLTKVLLDENSAPAGDGEVTWDGTDDRGQPAPNGIYLYQLSSGSEVETRKMLLLRQ